MNIQRQLHRLNGFGFLSCLRISDAVWVVLLATRGFSLWEIGVAEGIFHVVSLVCEIPSGMVADLIGRRRSLVAAGISGIVSALLMAFSVDFTGVCLSMAFSALAYNFISGSDEALLYDSLLQVGRQDDYLSVSARYTQAQNLGSMLSNGASLLAAILSFAHFYLLDAAVCGARVLTALRLKEPTVTKAQASRQQHPFRELGDRFQKHIRGAWCFFRSCPRVTPVMLADGLIALPGYLTLMFLQQRLSELGLSTIWLGLPIIGISLSRMIGVAVGKRLRPRHLRALYVGCALLVGLGTICAGAAPMLPAVLGAMVAAGGMDAWVLHLQRYLNKMFPSDQRATLVSINMMVYSLLMIFVSPLAGWLGDVCHTAGAGLCALGILVLATGGASMLVNRARVGKK